jgi:hypothetical protein
MASPTMRTRAILKDEGLPALAGAFADFLLSFDFIVEL